MNSLARASPGVSNTGPCAGAASRVATGRRCWPGRLFGRRRSRSASVRYTERGSGRRRRLGLLSASDHDAGTRRARHALPRTKSHDRAHHRPRRAGRRLFFPIRGCDAFGTGQRRPRRSENSLRVRDVGSRGKVEDRARRGPALVGHAPGARVSAPPAWEVSLVSTADDRDVRDPRGLSQRHCCRQPHQVTQILKREAANGAQNVLDQTSNEGLQVQHRARNLSYHTQHPGLRHPGP